MEVDLRGSASVMAAAAPCFKGTGSTPEVNRCCGIRPNSDRKEIKMKASAVEGLA
jgi:hypothetical protein